MSGGVSFAFFGVAAALLGAGVNARRDPARGQHPRLLFAAAALFFVAALIGVVPYLRSHLS